MSPLRRANATLVGRVVDLLTRARTHGSVDSQEERDSVTRWRELQSDKRRLFPRQPPQPTPSFPNHWCSPMCDCLNMRLRQQRGRRDGRAGGSGGTSLNLSETINMGENSHRDSEGVTESGLARKLNHSHSCHAMSKRVTIH